MSNNPNNTTPVPTWADDPRPKYETPQDDLPIHHDPHGRTDQPESPSLGRRYVPGSANGDQDSV
jgi:hypothetical protein